VESPQIIGGKYQVVRLIGGGGMGQVYEARHTGTGRRVAVKVIGQETLTKNKDAVARFQREARAAGAIETQHIAQVFDTGSDPDTGSPFMVMELLEGEDLAHALARLGPLPPELALRIVAQACIGLEKAHATGVVHRDIKPANLFLSKQEKGDVIVKVLDFGIAKVKVDLLANLGDAALTRTGSMLGSPVYMSPEQVKGEKDADHRSDVWSLGIVLYEALTGTTPHGHFETFGSLIFAICSETPRHVHQRAPWVPAEIGSLVQKALTIDATLRYQSAGEMLDAVVALLPDGTSLEVEMFVSLSGEQRRSVASPLAVTEPDLPQDLPRSRFGSTSGSGADSAIERTLEESPPNAPRSRMARTSMAVALVAVAGGVAVGYQFLAPHPPPVSAGPEESSVASSSPHPVPVASAPATPSQSAAATSTVPSVASSSPPLASAQAPNRRPPPVRPSSSASPAANPPIAPATSARRVDPGSYQ
jgi:serine/threonine protein kinase